MITNDKVIEIYCATDVFSKNYDDEIENMPLLSSYGKARRRRSATMSDSEIMTILIMFHFGTFD
ncbi:MAG: IS982 family transposase, partial [Bacteroidaceae bacterium]|nr:IS982 family transposase [Bacteroidaceae bacterium]